jgi:hypothetical protein
LKKVDGKMPLIHEMPGNADKLSVPVPVVEL